MLIKVLLAEKRQKPGLAKMIEAFLTKANKQRDDAQAQAASQEYEAAVKTLEGASKDLIRALRSSGIYVPG
jgi:hypothetical protein|tara:strand:+ start:1188 stop:1400 length:213 start_codon:yes stop_codon:yes gene_type:complete